MVLIGAACNDMVSLDLGALGKPTILTSRMRSDVKERFRLPFFSKTFAMLKGMLRSSNRFCFSPCRTLQSKRMSRLQNNTLKHQARRYYFCFSLLPSSPVILFS